MSDTDSKAQAIAGLQAERRVGPVLKVAIVGPESSGKTTLCQTLAAHYKTDWVPEYARTYAESKVGSLTSADVDPIARGQIAAEDRVLGTANDLVILDTDLTSTVFYANYLYGACADWIEREAERRLADLYLLTLPDLPWVADPVRSASAINDRLALVRYYEQMDSKIKLHKISGVGEQRHLEAQRAVDQLMRR